MTMTKPLSIRLHDLLKSDFPNSSHNLRRFACSEKYQSLKHHYRMYKDADGDLHLGFVDDTNCFFGRTLIRLACGDYQTFAYSLDSPVCSPVDVTEWFISEYKEKGMCAYTDMRHEWNENHKDSAPDGTTRTCIYCDKVETLKSKMVRKIWWD